MKRFRLTLFIAFFVVVRGLDHSVLFGQEKFLTLDGNVANKSSKKPLHYVNVQIKETRQGDVTDQNGYFSISKIKPGSYVLIVSIIGFKKIHRSIQLSQNMTVTVLLEEQPLLLETIEVTPGFTTLPIDEDHSNQITRRDILNSANLFSRDIYRSLQILPGISHTEWSSKPHIKGGNADETAVMIDNFEIFEPYHLDEIDGPFSIISSDLVQDMKVLTGGYSAKYPDKMSGILRINTVDRYLSDSVRMAADFMGISVNLNQRINDRIKLFSSARKSYLYIINKISANQYPASVYDLWNKIDYRVNQFNRITINTLMLNDDIEYQRDSTVFRNEFFNSYKRSYYGWINWRTFLSEAHDMITTFGYQKVHKKSDFAFDASYTSDNRDDRTTTLLTMKQDHHWIWHDHHDLNAGWETHRYANEYDYKEFRINPLETTPYSLSTDIMRIDKRIRGFAFSGYIEDHWQISDKFDLTIGSRASKTDYIKKMFWSPRSAIRFQATDRWSFILAIGSYYQPDNMQKMKIYQNQYQLENKPEHCIHYMTSARYSYHDDMEANVDVYFKDYRRLNDDYNYDFFNRISGIGIVTRPFFTVKGYSMGLDLFVRKQIRSNHNLTLAYSIARNRIQNYSGQETTRNLDRTHTLALNHIMKLPKKITIGTMWRYHSGDPRTSSEISILGDSSVTESLVYYSLDKINGKRLPSFHSLDLKIEKQWDLDRSTLVTYLSVINLYNRKNVRQYYWKREVKDQRIIRFVQTPQYYFPLVVLFGVSYELNVF